tara:strand:+ start:49 stop:627 length:579 start_codon:yes stop_codon:yes gene_type:complete
MGKEQFIIKKIDKKEASNIILKYHYLKDISKGFKSGYNYGLFKDDELLGVTIFTGFPVPELAKGMFGLNRNEQQGLFELSRLCLEPIIQKEEHNLSSWFVARCIKKLKKDTDVKAILSYADNDHHKGTVYKACNFNYYGLSDKKKDFWIKQVDGSFVKHSRGKTKAIDGEWRVRSQKHRYVIVFDKKLNLKW